MYTDPVYPEGSFDVYYNNEAPLQLIALYVDEESMPTAMRMAHWMYRLNDNVNDAGLPIEGRPFAELADLFETWDKEGAFAEITVLNALAVKELES
jgi:hypothetical protein